MRKPFIVLTAALALHRADDAGAIRGTMTCERSPSPGRVRCEVQAHAPDGEAIASGDVIIVRTPPFLIALRGRIGPHDATTRKDDDWRWALALAAQTKGTGDVEARLRLVVCRAATCGAREIPVVGHVVVGE